LKMNYQVCPICNGLFQANKVCKTCQQQMDEIGRMEDFMDLYNPYMWKGSFTIDNKELLIGDNLCVHLYYCELCHRIEHGSFPPSQYDSQLK